MKKEKKLPRISLCVLGLIILSSVFAGVLAPLFYGRDEPCGYQSGAQRGAHLRHGQHGEGSFHHGPLWRAALHLIGLLSACISTAVAVVHWNGERSCR